MTTVFVLDDDQDDLEILYMAVKDACPNCEVTYEVFKWADFETYRKYDVLVLDENLGPVYGTEIATILRRWGYSGKIVIVSGVGDLRPNFDRFINKNELHQLETFFKEGCP